MLRCAPLPHLDVRAFTTTFPAALGELDDPARLLPLLDLDASAPVARDDATQGAVRDLLRNGRYKPTGRGKPSSEYLLKAVGGGSLGAINPAVDACNVVSLHSGLPISVVDLDRARAPLSIALAAPKTTYVFNASGQVIDVGDLLCLHDADGPCANPVKDAQRTKTSAATRRTLSVVWGTDQLQGRAEAAARWYRELLARFGATTEAVAVRVEDAP
ncbi:MAG: phenylalanine--tRNA ligase beta subunit-related protein [Nannocystaceae bacterium]